MEKFSWNIFPSSIRAFSVRLFTGRTLQRRTARKGALKMPSGPPATCAGARPGTRRARDGNVAGIRPYAVLHDGGRPGDRARFFLRKRLPERPACPLPPSRVATIARPERLAIARRRQGRLPASAEKPRPGKSAPRPPDGPYGRRVQSPPARTPCRLRAYATEGKRKRESGVVPPRPARRRRRRQNCSFASSL